METAAILTQLVGTQYNLVGFDPRGVNNSGPSVDCFAGDSDALTAFQLAFFSEVSNASSTSLAQQFFSADIFGERCTAALRSQNDTGKYISTPAVAQDMLSYIKAEQELVGKPQEDAMLWYYSLSYGTVLGQTFASMFPNNVGRLILDGVFDAQDYYDLGWRTNIVDADEALETFSTYCHQAGPKNCTFWGPSAQNISTRLDKILTNLKNYPVPVAGLEAGSTAGLATYSDLKQLMFWALYVATDRFPVLADALHGLEEGNGSAVVNGWQLAIGDNEGTLIRCVDGYGNRTALSSIEKYATYVKLLESQSKYFGEVWPNNANTVLCRSLELDVDHSALGEYTGQMSSGEVVADERSSLWPRDG